MRLRPNGRYVLWMLFCAVSVLSGVIRADRQGTLIAVCSSGTLVMLAVPIIISTVCRVPVVAVEETGIRLPLRGVRLSWREVATVEVVAAKRSVALYGKTRFPVLLIVPAEPEAVLGRVRPWRRRAARGNIARYGTPIIPFDLSLLDHSIDDIIAAAAHLQRRATA